MHTTAPLNLDQRTDVRINLRHNALAGSTTKVIQGIEAIAADHNMTMYEATLAYGLTYGPTYGQMLTTDNYQIAHYDWFSTLFTPLSNVVVAFGCAADDVNSKPNQILVAMEWGQGENYKNPGGAIPIGVDRQGPGILPRATDSFNAAQFKLLTQAQTYKRSASSAPFIVATHFTIINYGNDATYDQKLSFEPSNIPGGGGNPGFNNVNTGTCERGLKNYVAQWVQGDLNGSTKRLSTSIVDCAFDQTG